MVSSAVSGRNVDINNPWYSCQSMMLSLENLDVWEWILQTFYPNVLLCDAVVNRNVNLLHVVVQSFIYRIQIGELLMLVLTVHIKSIKFLRSKEPFWEKVESAKYFCWKKLQTQISESYYTQKLKNRNLDIYCTNIY